MFMQRQVPAVHVVKGPTFQSGNRGRYQRKHKGDKVLQLCEGKGADSIARFGFTDKTAVLPVAAARGRVHLYWPATHHIPR